MLIVEGPDGAGKSTLVGELCEHFSTDVEERACTSDNGVDPRTLKEWVDRDMARPVREHTLYDRHPLISEPIYGPIIRGFMADGFNDPMWMAVKLSEFRMRDPFVIFCLPPLEAVELNVVSSHEPTTLHLEGVVKNCRALYDQYTYLAALFASGDIATQIWDYTDPDDKPLLLERAERLF